MSLPTEPGHRARLVCRLEADVICTILSGNGNGISCSSLPLKGIGCATWGQEGTGDSVVSEVATVFGNLLALRTIWEHPALRMVGKITSFSAQEKFTVSLAFHFLFWVQLLITTGEVDL